MLDGNVHDLSEVLLALDESTATYPSRHNRQLRDGLRAAIAQAMREYKAR